MPPDPQRIVVGYDGSADAGTALLWAARAARNRRSPLRVLVVASAMDPVLSDHHEVSRRQAQEWKAQAEHLLRDAGADGTVEVREGPPYPVLLRTAGPWDLLVVGCRGHGLAAGTFLGSVSQHVVRHARCPVVVVRSPHAATARQTTVGVDGSAAGEAALQWAGAHCAVTGEELVAVSVCSAATQAADGALDEDERRQLDVAELRLRNHLGLVRRAHPDLLITERIEGGSPGQVLVDASERSSLVVVGTRGRDPFAELALGSTAQFVLSHAECPVAVVRQWPPTGDVPGGQEGDRERTHGLG